MKPVSRFSSVLICLLAAFSSSLYGQADALSSSKQSSMYWEQNFIVRGGLYTMMAMESFVGWQPARVLGVGVGLSYFTHQSARTNRGPYSGVSCMLQVRGYLGKRIYYGLKGGKGIFRDEWGFGEPHRGDMSVLDALLGYRILPNLSLAAGLTTWRQRVIYRSNGLPPYEDWLGHQPYYSFSMQLQYTIDGFGQELKAGSALYGYLMGTLGRGIASYDPIFSNPNLFEYSTNFGVGLELKNGLGVGMSLSALSPIFQQGTTRSQRTLQGAGIHVLYTPSRLVILGELGMGFRIQDFYMENDGVQFRNFLHSPSLFDTEALEGVAPYYRFGAGTRLGRHFLAMVQVLGTPRVYGDYQRWDPPTLYEVRKEYRRMLSLQIGIGYIIGWGKG